MSILEIIGEILPVIGTIGLFGLWLYQQKEIEKHTNELRKINSARNVYQTYQSNNALFNALLVLTNKNKSSSDEIESFQIYNYELGLTSLEDALSQPEKKGIPAKTAIAGLTGNLEKDFENTQKRLEMLQIKLLEKEEKIKLKSDKSKNRYFVAYVCFSVISIVGAIFKILNK